MKFRVKFKPEWWDRAAVVFIVGTLTVFLFKVVHLVLDLTMKGRP